MKKLTAMLLAAALLLGLCACKGSSEGGDRVPTVVSQMEYVLYQNIFFNGQASDYTDQPAEKIGTFVRLQDRFHDRVRYYVWGYYDNTKCCDWQWEFVPKDPSSLPAEGSLVKMTGTLRYDEQALDHYWFTDAEVTVKTAYAGPAADVDACLMSATLERVQLINVQQYPADFEGKSLRLYGRILQPTVLQHPYYDNSWTQVFDAALPAPAIGTVVTVSGVWSEGTVKKAVVTATSDY